MITFIKSLFKPKADLAKLVKEGAVIVDVRTKGEFQAGHIEGSKNIPLDTVKNEVGKLKQLNKPVVTVCRSGNRSGIAANMLEHLGYKNVKNLVGGMLNWQKK